MKSLKWTQRILLTFGVIAIVYSVGSVAYSKAYQYYESSKFDEAIAVGRVSRIERVPGEGEPIGKLVIARLGVSVIVLEGVENGTLRLGAGHVPETAMPGSAGNVAIAAHRDSYFRTVEGIKVGDRVQVETLKGVYEYNVDSTEIVNPEDTNVLNDNDYPELTLITCYPFHFIGSAPYRFIVHARQIQ